YSLSSEELSEWMSAVSNHGLKALRATKIQNYRQP
ncbi:MAG: DUF1153 domain-containing protein, partial [Pseudomonadota bacterium]|nr:DUF1153 domain-containing protein [Pseudomonadota bacterium]